MVDGNRDQLVLLVTKGTIDLKEMKYKNLHSEKLRPEHQNQTLHSFHLLSMSPSYYNNVAISSLCPKVGLFVLFYCPYLWFMC